MIKLKNILNESIQHELAIELISSLIKDSEWKGKVFAAGGYVRDKMMGIDSKDIDLTIHAPNGGLRFAEWITKKLNIYKKDTNPVMFEKFGTSKFNLRGIKYKGEDLSDVDIECVMSRKEKYTDGSRKPEVDYGTPQQDVERRDLTINSLLKDLTTGEILDLTGKGISDIKNGIIRTPLEPDIIFKEDPLRMLRCVRFTVKYNWKLPFYMIKALKNNAHLLKTISSERIQDELNKILMTDNPDKGVRILQLTGLYKHVIPEIEPLIGLKQNKYHKHDAFKHTMQVLKSTPKNLIVRLSGLMHDIGKAKTKEVINNEITFYGHEKVSADMAREILKRLSYPNDIIDAVAIGIENHMRLKQSGAQGEIITDKAIRRLQNDLGQHLQNVLALINADNISHADKYILPNQVSGIQDRLNKIGDFTKKLNIPIDGDDVLRLTGEKPGKIIGQLLDIIKDKFLENPNITKQEAEDIVKTSYAELNKTA